MEETINILKITSEELKESKRLTDLFDSRKTFNKFLCETNYIGVL